MQPRLKENPREWKKFGLVLFALPALIAALAAWRELWWPATAMATAGIAGAALAILWQFPRALRSVYRTGMTVSFHVGQTIGQFLLAILFFLVFTPLGLFLRFAGKDPLNLQKPAQNKPSSFWIPAKPPSQPDQMF